MLGGEVMKRLYIKAKYLNGFYNSLVTVMICQLVFGDMEWRKVLAFGVATFLVVGILFDKRLTKNFN